jgi:hypothetical protein
MFAAQQSATVCLPDTQTVTAAAGCHGIQRSVCADVYTYIYTYVYIYNSCGSPTFRGGMTGYICIIYTHTHTYIAIYTNIHSHIFTYEYYF